MPEPTYACCGRVNRGLAILGNSSGHAGMRNWVAVDPARGRKKPTLEDLSTFP